MLYVDRYCLQTNKTCIRWPLLGHLTQPNACIFAHGLKGVSQSNQCITVSARDFFVCLFVFYFVFVFVFFIFVLFCFAFVWFCFALFCFGFFFFFFIRTSCVLWKILTAYNWQKRKRVFLTCSCHKIYRDEAAVGVKNYKYTWKITSFVKMWNLGQYHENLIFCQ